MYGNGILVAPPNSSEVVDISSADYTFTNKSITAIYVGGAGTGILIAQLAGDATARTWKGIASGTYIHGNFVKVTKTGTGTTDMIGVTGVRDAKAGL